MSQPASKALAAEARQAALQAVRLHPMLAPVAQATQFQVDSEHQHVAPSGWLAVSPTGTIWMHGKRRATPEAWTRVMAIALVCLGFGLVRRQEPYELWELASLLVADRFCGELRLGQLPLDLVYPEPVFPTGGADGLLRLFCVEGCDPALLAWRQRLCASGTWFCQFDAKPMRWQRPPPRWQDLLADGIARDVGHAIERAAGMPAVSGAIRPLSKAQKARRRLIDHYPLLGALAASFNVEEDPRLCQQYDIRVAAIDVGMRTIWVNPAAGLSDEECLFVFAHELLHAGLNHASRRRGRDPLLWNIACDFIINGWLIEMQVGSAPSMGLLHDAAFSGQSSEDVYDSLAQDIRRARKLATLRGVGVQDMLGDDDTKQFTDAEAYCRRALAQGFGRFTSATRGVLPAGLIEEIRSLSQPPIPWDVKLAYWFDERFAPPELRRSYARPSRRQSATPDYPRPSKVKPTEEERRSRVFGVLLDTSGSMEPRLLGKALGAIASYALARDVSAVRLICCDAHAFDSGWVPPEALLERFAVHGRGGTVLQPGLDLLRDLAVRGDFPKSGPLLVITDGYCESQLSTAMDHAYLLPEGRYLPFRARGEVFHVSP